MTLKRNLGISFSILSIGLIVVLVLRQNQSHDIPSLRKSVHPKQEFNILWLTAESMKPEHLGAYGYKLPTSPNIDAFAKTATLFRSCFNPSGWTSENMVSNLTGVYSPLHGVDSRGKHVPFEWYLPLERLRDMGYRVPYMQGFQQDTAFQHLGFDGAIANIEPTYWLETHKDSRFMMWFHLLQTHLPYDAPEPHHSLFWKDSLIPNEASRARIESIRKHIIIPRGSVTFKKDEDLPAIRALYDADVHYMDEKFGEIIATLDRLGLRDKTIVIFSADHGEEQLEHGFVGHASTARGGHLHDEITHVPLIISLPGKIPQGLTINSQVRGIDILPTIYDILGLPNESYFQGDSLMPVIQTPEAAKDRIAYAASSYRGYQETDPQNVLDFMYAVRSGEWKLIRNVRGKEVKNELFNLKNDQSEMVDVGAQFSEKLNEMITSLDDWLTKTKSTQVTLEPNAAELSAVLKTNIGNLPIPSIKTPEEDETLSFDSTKGEIVVTWDGNEKASYVLELRVGSGIDQLETSLEIDGLEVRRSFSQSYWNEYIKRYDRAQFRVKINAAGHEWSPWRNVKIR